MLHLNRRQFLAATGLSLGSAALHAGDAPATEPFSFYLVGDTHYCASRTSTDELIPASRTVTTGLVDTLNRLPGTAIPAAAGGGTVAPPRGVIHVGDVIHSGDRTGAMAEAMQRTEWRAYEADFGLTGRDGRLRWPVYEVHGNHDAPRGEGLAIDAIRRRNRTRPGVMHVSANGLHYSWDWGPVHFINLGIVVGAVREVRRERRFAPLDSLAFLNEDLTRHVRDRTRPIILTHHVDVLRYSGACDENARAGNPEWDACDVRGYYQAIRGYNVVGVLYGHTHTRNVFRWDGTRTRAQEGIPVFNNDKSSHFASPAQAFMYCTVTEREYIVREYATRNVWREGHWTPQVWRVPLRAG